MTTHSNGPDSARDVPISKGTSPMAKALMVLALVVIFIQGGITVIASGFGRLPPAEAVKVQLPPPSTGP
jgi:hypothetical protein